jgi:hypothetical protein
LGSNTSRRRAKIPAFTGLTGFKYARVSVMFGRLFRTIEQCGACCIVGVGIAGEAGADGLIVRSFGPGRQVSSRCSRDSWGREELLGRSALRRGSDSRLQFVKSCFEFLYSSLKATLLGKLNFECFKIPESCQARPGTKDEGNTLEGLSCCWCDRSSCTAPLRSRTGCRREACRRTSAKGLISMSTQLEHEPRPGRWGGWMAPRGSEAIWRMYAYVP